MGLFDVLDDLFDDVVGLFGGHGDSDQRWDDLSAQQWDQGVLPGGVVPWGSAPRPPGGPSGLQQGAEQAGTTYQQAGGAVDEADEKLADLLKKIFAANDANRSKISGIIASIASTSHALTSNPQLAGKPHAVAWFNRVLDGKLAQIQQVLDSSKVDSKKQAELLAALGDQYRDTTSGDPEKKGADGDGRGSGSGGEGSNGGTGQSSDSGGGGGGGAGGGLGSGETPTDGGGVGSGLIDPLAGLGGAGLGGPLSMLGPALAGLGSVPGALGGAAGSLPLDALGAVAPLAGQLAGQGGADGFTDSGSHGGVSDDFHDGPQGKGDGGAAGAEASEASAAGGNGGEDASTQTTGAAEPQSGDQPAPAAAVPASAGGDPSRVVQMPDGSMVTATTAQHATAVRAVLDGSTVSDGWKQGRVEFPPPGTPVTAPADPSRLIPGEIAQFKSRDPVMYMGNGKIWLDGQLQPESALPTGDFLAWVDPVQLAGTASVPLAPATATPVPAGPPGIAGS